jgi:hypothetical protein
MYEAEEEKMKKQYENAEMEILEFEVSDVITISDGGIEEDGGWEEII